MRLQWMVVLTAVLLVCDGAARGDALVEPSSALRRARTMRQAGVAVSATGIASEVVTIVLFAVWVHQIDDAHSRSGEYASVPFNLAAGGFVTAGLAPLLLGVGIPLWSVGARRERRAAVNISADGAIRF